MHRILVGIVALGVFLFAGFGLAAETNGVVTNWGNAIGSSSTNQGPTPAVSDAELQAQAKQVLWMVLGFWIVALVGALVVAGFAVYGAYKKFGARGVAVVVVILILAVWMFGNFLLSF
jgi:hypothetical protein